MSFVEFVSDILSFLALIGGFLIVFHFGHFIYWKKTGNKWEGYWQVLEKYGLLFAFLVASTATLGSLFYSEIAGYNPCKLCWYQRIFMYPQVILLGVAVYRKYKKEIVVYTRWLSMIGALFSSYHYYLQRWGGENISCSAVGYSNSCVQNFVLDYGYITIPVMALTAFLLILIYSHSILNMSFVKRK